LFYIFIFIFYKQQKSSASKIRQNDKNFRMTEFLSHIFIVGQPYGIFETTSRLCRTPPKIFQISRGELKYLSQ